MQAEHRRWSGIDDRDPLVIYFKDLDLTDHVQRGRRAVIDLRDISTDWVVRSLLHWARNTRLSSTTMYRMVGVWRVVDEVLQERVKTPEQLGSQDMDAIVRAVRAKWPAFTEQGHRLPMLWRLIEYGHKTDDLADIWSASRRGSARTQPPTVHTRGPAVGRIQTLAVILTSRSASCPSPSSTG